MKSIDLTGIEQKHEFFNHVRGLQEGSYKVTGASLDLISDISESIFDYSVAYRTAQGETGPGTSVKERPLTFVSSEMLLVVSPHDWNNPSVAKFFELPLKERALDIIERAKTGRVEIPADNTQLLSAVRNYAYGQESGVAVRFDGEKYIVSVKQRKQSVKDICFECFGIVERDKTPRPLDVDISRMEYVRILASKYNQISDAGISITSNNGGILVTLRSLIPRGKGNALPVTNQLITKEQITKGEYEVAKAELQKALNNLKEKVK